MASRKFLSFDSMKDGENVHSMVRNMHYLSWILTSSWKILLHALFLQAYLTDLKDQEEDKCLLQVLPAQNEISGQMGEYVSHSFYQVTMYAWTLSCISFLLVLLVQVLPGDFIRLECVTHKGTFILCAQSPDTSRYVLAAFPELLRWSCLS